MDAKRGAKRLLKAGMTKKLESGILAAIQQASGPGDSSQARQAEPAAPRKHHAIDVESSVAAGFGKIFGKERA